MLPDGEPAPIFSLTACRVVHELIDLEISTLQTYKCDVVNKTAEYVRKYWSKYGNISKDIINTESSSERNDSAYVFPGRRMVRQTIVGDR